MPIDLQVEPTPDDVAAAASAFVAATTRAAVVARGHCTLAVSGGKTPVAMFTRLANEDVPWPDVTIYQVDERVAPAGDPDRNLTHLLGALGSVPAEIIPMPVNDDDLEAAAARYAAELPDEIDLVHLGLGPDGHTASLVPGDPVLEVRDRLVAVTGPYRGRRRMTFTYPALERAALVLWVVTGADKREPLAKMLAGDPSIPAGRVQAARSLVIADTAAAPA